MSLLDQKLLLPFEFYEFQGCHLLELWTSLAIVPATFVAMQQSLQVE